MNILVIGNGFDIAHGLPTQYKDFLAFVQGFQDFNDVPDKTENKFYQYFTQLRDTKPEIFTELGVLIKGNAWLDHFFKSLPQKDGWIDFEKEISDVIQNFDAWRNKLKDKDLTRPVLVKRADVEKALFEGNFTPENYNRIKSGLIDSLNKLIRCLEIYLCEYINFDNCKRFKDISELTINKVLSFNYTDTYRKIYNNSVDIDFIHGKAEISHNIDSCNMVLGIDEYLPEEERDKDNEFIQFKKFFQRIYKGTGCHYADWLYHRDEYIRALNGASIPELNIYFYGHSLDVTDADILRRLIFQTGAKTTIYHHNPKALGDQIANLVKVIGEEELIKRTDGSNRSIIFKPTSEDTA